MMTYIVDLRGLDTARTFLLFYKEYDFCLVLPALVQIIFHFLWDHWAQCGIFENGDLLMYTLEGVSSVANFITAYEESQ